MPLAIGTITAMVATYGTNAMAAFNIANNIEAICRISYFALAAAITPFMAQNMGAETYDRMRAASHYCLVFCLAWGFILAIIIAAFAETIVGFFNNTLEVVQIASTYLFIVPISYGCCGLVRIITAGLNGMGRPLPGTNISFIRAFILQIPFVILFGKYYGLLGIFTAICISNILASILGYFWNKRILNRLT